MSGDKTLPYSSPRFLLAQLPRFLLVPHILQTQTSLGAFLVSPLSESTLDNPHSHPIFPEMMQKWNQQRKPSPSSLTSSSAFSGLALHFTSSNTFLTCYTCRLLSVSIAPSPHICPGSGAGFWCACDTGSTLELYPTQSRHHTITYWKNGWIPWVDETLEASGHSLTRTESVHSYTATCLRMAKLNFLRKGTATPICFQHGR